MICVAVRCGALPKLLCSLFMIDGELQIGLWNVEYASIRTRKGALLAPMIASLSPELLCLTEGHANLLPDFGHVITSEGDYGYYKYPEARKVLLWSRTPWAQVDTEGTAGMPKGRFIAGTTETSLGTLRIFGVCIPWHEAHVRSGYKNRKLWEDHLTYLRELAPILRNCNTSIPAVVMGDFNQRVPRRWQPQEVYDALMGALSPKFEAVTSGVIEDAPAHTIDHVAVSHHLRRKSVRYISNLAEDGKELSDHFGLQVTLASAG